MKTILLLVFLGLALSITHKTAVHQVLAQSKALEDTATSSYTDTALDNEELNVENLEAAVQAELDSLLTAEEAEAAAEDAEGAVAEASTSEVLVAEADLSDAQGVLAEAEEALEEAEQAYDEELLQEANLAS